jgi:uncharacterized protein YndB with AHSA1/START domain
MSPAGSAPSRRRGHERRRSPVEIRLEVEAEADPEVVWEILARVERWRTWHRGVDFAVLRGELAEGTRLDWRVDGLRIRSRLREVEFPRRLGFTVRMIGGHGYARWTLEPTPAGGTLVRTEELWEGFLVRMLRRTLSRTLTVSRTAWLEALRDRAEGTR